MSTLNHADERSEERMHVGLGYSEQLEIIMMIRQGRNAVLEQYSNRAGREIWQVYYKDRVFRVVYDIEVEFSLITVKPPPRRREWMPGMLEIVRRNRKQAYFTKAA
jgi:hypothetical protein